MPGDSLKMKNEKSKDSPTDEEIVCDVGTYMGKMFEAANSRVEFPKGKADRMEYLEFACFLRTIFPWFSNTNGSKKRNSWGNAAPCPSVNTTPLSFFKGILERGLVDKNNNTPELKFYKMRERSLKNIYKDISIVSWRYAWVFVLSNFYYQFLKIFKPQILLR